MDVSLTPLADVLVLKPTRFRDDRGFFSESYSRRRLADAGLNVDFVHDNVSVSKSPGTLRGLHFQRAPFAQVKLVSVMQGAARDVVVDIRRSSPTFGRHFSIVLSAEEGNQIFVPIGFAHGFLTLEPDTMLSYKVSNYYLPEHDSGIRFDDPRLGIDWGLNPAFHHYVRKGPAAAAVRPPSRIFPVTHRQSHTQLGQFLALARSALPLTRQRACLFRCRRSVESLC
jgi:dTDP-4-dehydrorhamnose 3,5-epimerase